MASNSRSSASGTRVAATSTSPQEILSDNLRLREIVALREEVIRQLNRRIVQLESTGSASNSSSLDKLDSEPTPEALADCYSRIEALTRELVEVQREFQEQERAFRQRLDELSSRVAPIDRLEKTRLRFLIKPIYRAMRSRDNR